MVQFRANAARMAGIKVFGSKIGCDPGMAMSKGETCAAVLGFPGEEVESLERAGEKSLRVVLSCAWISMPTVSSQPGTVCLFVEDFLGCLVGEDFAALASSLSCLRRGVIGAEVVDEEVVVVVVA